MTRISIRGSIINGDSAWIYNWLKIPYTTAEKFKEELAAADGDVIVEINSPGGYVAPAAEIYEAIRTYKGNIECHVVGQAASAASIIACAAKSTITPMGTLFLHNCIGSTSGNHNDMRQAMHAMESIDENIMEAYRAKTGLTDAEIYELMEDNTTLNARQAVEYGFIDAISESAADAAQASSAVNGIAAASIGFIDLAAAIDPASLSAMREAYENSIRASNGEGGETMDIEGIRDTEAAEEPETEEIEEIEEVEEGDAADADAGTDGDGDAEGLEEPEGGEVGEADADDSEDAQAAYERGVLAERARIAAIMDIAASVPDSMTRDALFVNPISAEELALAAMRADSETRAEYMDKARADANASGSANVAADVTDGNAVVDDVQDLAAKMNKRFGRE